MAYKDPQDERLREKRRDHYYNNKEQYYERNRKKRAEIRALLDEVKSAPCQDCGVKYPPYVMDFDHRDPSKKEFAVATLVSCGNLGRVEREIAKCDIVCANCHRERTHG